MKIGYNYKLQWLFEIKENFFDNEQTLRNKLYTMIRIVGGENITAVYFRDSHSKIINQHTLKNPAIFGKEFATIKLKRYIKKVLDKDPRVYSVELIRK